jgi:hypothetical protein
MLIKGERRRACARSITINDCAGSAVTLDTNDKVRLKVGHSRRTPLIDLLSPTANSNGSSVTTANPTTMFLSQTDMDLEPGIYDIEVAIIDASQSNAIKHAVSGVLAIEAVPLGNVGAS